MNDHNGIVTDEWYEIYWESGDKSIITDYWQFIQVYNFAVDGGKTFKVVRCTNIFTVVDGIEINVKVTT